MMIVGWINVLWYIYIMEYYAEMKMNKLQADTTELGLRNKMLRKEARLKRERIVCFHSFKVENQAKLIYRVRIVLF